MGEVLTFSPMTEDQETRPCPAKVTGPFLGASAEGDPTGQTVVISCGNIEGHDGEHEFFVRWTDA